MATTALNFEPLLIQGSKGSQGERGYDGRNALKVSYQFQAASISTGTVHLCRVLKAMLE